MKKKRKSVIPGPDAYEAALYTRLKATEPARRAADKQALEPLYQELRDAGTKYSKVCRVLSKIRAEVKARDFVRDGKIFPNEFNQMEKHILVPWLLIVRETPCVLPTIPELHKVANGIAKKLGQTSYTERGVRKAIQRLGLPVSPSKPGRRLRVYFAPFRIEVVSHSAE
jgi:hypothetical protein